MPIKIRYNYAIAGMDQRRKLGRPRQAIVGEAVDQQDQPTCSNVFVVQVAARRVQNYHLLRPASIRYLRQFSVLIQSSAATKVLAVLSCDYAAFPADHFVV
jgi:hypothetical protein